MSETKSTFDFSLITDAVLGRAGPGRSADVSAKDKHKIVGPASAKAVILTQSSTVDAYGIAENQRRK